MQCLHAVSNSKELVHSIPSDPLSRRRIMQGSAGMVTAAALLLAPARYHLGLSKLNQYHRSYSLSAPPLASSGPFLPWSRKASFRCSVTPSVSRPSRGRSLSPCPQDCSTKTLLLGRAQSPLRDTRSDGLEEAFTKYISSSLTFIPLTPQVVVHYIAMTPNLRIFDNSLQRGAPYDIR